jgi:hypothetical protein
MTPRRRSEGKRPGISKWQEPPPKRQSYDWVTIADDLRARPMEWALIFKRDRTSLVNALRQGAITPLHPDLGFEIRSANNTRDEDERRVCDLYLRYNPARVMPLREDIRKTRKDK